MAVEDALRQPLQTPTIVIVHLTSGTVRGALPRKVGVVHMVGVHAIHMIATLGSIIGRLDGQLQKKVGVVAMEAAVVKQRLPRGSIATLHLTIGKQLGQLTKSNGVVRTVVADALRVEAAT